MTESIHHQVLRVGYLLRMYPRFSQTFVVNEIQALERLGTEVLIASLRLPNEGIFHESVTKVRAQATYLEDRFLGCMRSQVAAQWGFFRRSPRKYAALARIVRQHRSIAWFEMCQAAAFVRWARKQGIEHVHVHFGTDEANVAMFAHMLGGPTYSMTLHAFDIFRDNVDRSLLARKINHSQFTVTVCESNRKFLTECVPGVDARKVRVIYNGIDLKEFSPADDRREPNSIFSVGRLIEKKGFGHLIRAVAVLRDLDLPVICRIAGEGRDYQKLAKQIRQHNLEKQVMLLGSVRQNEVRDWMKRSACFALPCIQAKDGNIDALPTVLLESLACGCPSVSTRLSGVPEIIEDGVSGLLVEPCDDAALADAIRRIHSDSRLAKSLAEGGRARAVDRFNGMENVARLRDLFAGVLGCKPASATVGSSTEVGPEPTVSRQHEAA